jgi:hypothetical protein
MGVSCNERYHTGMEREENTDQLGFTPVSKVAAFHYAGLHETHC